MNLPPHFQFDLALAKVGWPLVTRDGRKAKVFDFEHISESSPKYPLIGMVTKDGDAYGLSDTPIKLHLSSNLRDPAVRAAVEAAHKAGEPISNHHDRFDGIWFQAHPTFSWEEYHYLPTRLLSQLPQPWTPPPLPDGWEIYEPAIGDYTTEALWVAKDYPDDCHGGKWTECDNFRVREKDLPQFLFARRKWTLPEPPPGQQWHRTDGWTREMLPEGWRPLLLGEMPERGDEIFSDKWLLMERGAFSRPARPAEHHQRTRRPLPAPVVYWSAPEHVPGPVCWLSDSPEVGNVGSLIVGVGRNGVDALNGTTDTVTQWTWADLEEYKFSYSTTRQPGSWLPCTLPAQ